MLKNSHVAIIGAGCVGLSTAYHLAKSGVKDIVVLEQSYLGAGSTARCAGGIRQQWTATPNILLAKKSVEMFEDFQDEIGQDIEFRQGGYLLPAYDDITLDEFQQDIELQNKSGVQTRLIDPYEVKQIAPLLDTSEMTGACFGPGDGRANPFLVLEGYANRCRELGVRICLNTRVVGLTEAGAGFEVTTERERFHASYVVNAAGGYARDIANMLGIDINVRPYKHQILITEPVKQSLSPFVVDLKRNLYFSQCATGGFIAGHSDSHQVSDHDCTERWQSGAAIARKLVRAVPSLSKISVLRQWAGSYASTPDAQPILGPTMKNPSFILACGFSGHGFMLCPVAGKLVAECITNPQELSLDIESFLLERFEVHAPLVAERNVV